MREEADDIGAKNCYESHLPFGRGNEGPHPGGRANQVSMAVVSAKCCEA